MARMNVGGTAVYLENLQSALIQQGIQSPLSIGHVQAPEIEDECVASMEIIRVKNLKRAISPLNDLLAFFQLWRIVRRVKPDLIHTHTFKAGALGRLIPFSGKRVHTFHGHILSDGSLSKAKVQIVIKLEQFLAKRSDALISVGQVVANQLREVGIGNHQRWESMPPGCEKPKLPDRQSANKRLGLEGDRIRIGWLGRMIDVKDPDLLLEIARERPEIEFLMAGGGEELERIRNVAPANVRVLGWVDRADLLAAIDLLVMTSKSEGMPLAAIEAQLCGVRVVAPDVGSLAEVLPNGVIVERSVQAFCKGIDQALNNPMNQDELAWAEKNFSVDKMGERHAKLYSELIKGN